MSKRPKKKNVRLDKKTRKAGKRNLYILLALAVAGATFVIVGSTMT